MFIVKTVKKIKKKGKSNGVWNERGEVMMKKWYFFGIFIINFQNTDSNNYNILLRII